MADSTPLWPAWKFGLKQDDLNTLQQQYNTFPCAIQDPEAFHHDVLEISAKAKDLDELSALLFERRNLRLCELREALDSAAYQIVGDPNFLPAGADQWQHALRIFRWQSLDALVQYFASYLPPEQRDRAFQEQAAAFADARQSVQFQTPFSSLIAQALVNAPSKPTARSKRSARASSQTFTRLSVSKYISKTMSRRRRTPAEKNAKPSKTSNDDVRRSTRIAKQKCISAIEIQRRVVRQSKPLDQGKMAKKLKQLKRSRRSRVPRP